MNYNDTERIKRGIKKALTIIAMVILGIGVAILMGFVVMWLWNWLMPMIFNLTEITYWQAVGLFALAKIFFGGFGSDSSDSSKSKHRPGRKIKKEIGKEFSKEFDKAFDKEVEKETGKEVENCKSSNTDYDELYEKWWDEKGENNFNKYMDDIRDIDNNKNDD